jgi:hypothetical protein
LLSFCAESFVFQFTIQKCKVKIYRTIIFPVVSCGYETWSIALRKECRLRVLESRVLRRIFRPKRDDVTGEWRRLHTEKFCALYPSPNFVRAINRRRMGLAGHVARMGARRGAYRVLVENPERRKHLEDPGADRSILLK